MRMERLQHSDTEQAWSAKVSDSGNDHIHFGGRGRLNGFTSCSGAAKCCDRTAVGYGDHIWRVSVFQ
jgi:hypothetical protein